MLLRYSFVLVIAMLMVGCATLFSGTQEEITIRTDVDDAEIYVDGRMIGRGEASFSADRTHNKSHVPTVRVEAKGYKTQEFSLQRSFNNVAIVNLTFIYSWTTDFLTGAMFEYAPNEFMVHMVEEGTAGLNEAQKLERFVLGNATNIKKDLAVGEGVYLEAVWELSGDDRLETIMNDAETRDSLLQKEDSWSFYAAFMSLKQ